MHGWMGKILHVDLTSGSVGEIATERYVDYVGGRGIASRLYWERVGPEVAALSPENRLILMTGPLVGTGAQGAARMCVAGKSPMTLPEAYCYGNLGGLFPAELKKAGWDGIVLDGRAPEPVRLVVDDGAVRLEPAGGLWGKSALAAEEAIKKEYGDRWRFLTTGIAGENGVRTATMYASLSGSVSAGFGAVMAAKNLKAVVVRGTSRAQAADPARMAELSRYTRELSRTCNFAVVRHIHDTGRGHLLEALGGRRCHGCALECQKTVYRIGGDPELTGLRGCQAMEYYLPWTLGREDEPNKTLFDAPTLANDHSICTFELGAMIEWLHRCARSGVLTDETTGLPLSRMGTREFLEALLEAISNRRGFGDILAEGMVRVRDLVSPEAAALFPHSVAAVGQTDGVPPRAYVAHALVYPFETRMHPVSLHETAYLCRPWSAHQGDPGSSPVTPEVYVQAAAALWGSEAAADMLGYEGKAAAARAVQNRAYLRDSLGLCDFIYPVSYSFGPRGPLGDPDLEGKLFEAATGRDASELPVCAERVFNMQRLISLREGHRPPEDDYPPEFNFIEPLPAHGPAGTIIMPGPGGRPVDAVGNVLDRSRFELMLREYYELRGWDPTTGRPAESTLKALGMGDSVESG